MMTTGRFLSAAGATALLAATLGAQTQLFVQRGPGAPPTMVAPGSMGVTTAQAGTFEFIAAEPAFLERTVTGAPYSADAVSETTRVLSDGTRIKNTNTSKVFRDSEGRVRKEQAFGHLGFWVSKDGESKAQVTITDPVAKKTIILEPDGQTARVIPMPPMPPPPPSPPAAPGAVVTEDVTIHDAPPPPPAPPSPDGTEVHVTVATGATNMAEYSAQRSVQVIRGTKIEQVAPGSVGAVVLPRTMMYHGLEIPDNVQVEDLGEQMIQGVRTTGTRRTTTIPTGAIGNDRPIVSVVEEWRSPELQVLVQRSIKDPQVGETVYRLENLNRNEPLKSLFEVPSGYEIKDVQPRIQRIEMRKRSDG